jgi:large subunit ribosomal protein L15
LRLCPLNLDSLAAALQSGRLAATEGQALNMKDLRDAGAVGKIRDGVKLLGRGAQGFAAAGLQGLNLEVTRCSASARAAVEAAGGSVTTVHYNRLGLRALLKPHKFAPGMLPRPAQPPPKLRLRVDAVGGLPAGAPSTPIRGLELAPGVASG